jgi:prophage regulatory protein
MPTNKPAPLRAPEGRVLRRREVEAKVGHGHSWLYDKVRSGEFPEPVEIGKHSVGWLESEIDAWIASRPRRSSKG